jgi:ubiquinone/menaquinone biosynthesis C-methylase UbiE
MTSQAPPRTNGLVIDWAARYDLLAWLFTHGREGRLRERMIDIAGLEAGQCVLDIGCGTGTLAIRAARRVGPNGTVAAIDASPPMIARAQRKATRARVNVAFEVAPAESLPFAAGQFDVVLSTLMLHHLPRKTRQRCAKEVARVLKVGGHVMAVDFTRGNGRGLLAHLHRHGHVDIKEIAALFEDAGLRIRTSGPIGMNNLHFVIAQTSAGLAS